MKILVYGAGNIGCLYAAKLKDAGHDVSILARGPRADGIRKAGISLLDAQTGKKTTTHVSTLERLPENAAFDLVLAVLPRNGIRDSLAELAATPCTPNIMFFGNNAAGPAEMVQALGGKRVLLGFPGAAAVPREGVIRYLILDHREQPTTIGEIDGSHSSRVSALAEVFKSSGFPVSICSNMDAWLKTHVAEILPAAGALQMAECSVPRLRDDRNALSLMIQAIREGHRVLSSLAVPITPSSHRIFRWIPQFMLVLTIRHRLHNDLWNIKIGHAAAASEEMRALADDFEALIRRSGIETPAIRQLSAYLGRNRPSEDDGVGRIETNPPTHA